MRAPLVTAAIALSWTIPLAACSRPPAPDVVATSTLGEARKADLDTYILSQPESRRGPGAGQDTKTWRRSLLEEMLVSHALASEGRKSGVLDRPQAKKWLQDQIDSLLISEVERRRVAERANVTDAEIRAFYDTHPREVGHSGQIRLRHIFRRAPRDAPRGVREAARREMQDLLGRIRGGANFEEMARLHSDSETAGQGGLIGRLNHGNLGRSVEAIVWKLKEGEISDVVGTPVGFHIFKLETHIPPFKMDFDEALPRLRKRLVREATARTLREQVHELMAASGATFRPEAASSPDPGALVFSLGDDRVTRADWERALAAKSFPEKRETPLPDQLEAFVGRRLRLWEANRLKLAEEPALATRIAELKQAATVRLAHEERVKKALEANPAELEAFYKANRARFMTPQLHRVRLLWVPFPGDTVDYGVFERLQKLAGEIRAGRRSFADAAREMSADLTAPAGGDAGLVRLDAVGDWAGPQAYARIQKLKPGDVSDPILIERWDRNLLTDHREGYMLVTVEEIQEPHARLLEEVRDEVAAEYAARQFATLSERVRQDVLASIRARIYDRHL